MSKASMSDTEQIHCFWTRPKGQNAEDKAMLDRTAELKKYRTDIARL